MTQLCAIPGCRLRGRCLPGCADDQCPGCLPRLAEAGYACDVCVGRAAARLEAIIDLTADARLVAAGLVRRGMGGGSGKPASRPPLNDAATDVMDAIQNAITTIAREIAEIRGLMFGSDVSRARLSASVAAQNGSAVPTPTPGPQEAI